VSCTRRRLAPILAALVLAPALPALAAQPRSEREVYGPRYEPPRTSRPSQHRGPRRTDPIRHWNRLAIDASGLDHTPVAPGEDRTFGEQFGPGRSARAMAIVHIAVFEAVNAIAGGYESYLGLERAPYATSLGAAVAQAAHDTLIAMFPSQQGAFDEALDDELDRVRDWRARLRGVQLGRRAAEEILALRAHDGSHHAEPLYGTDWLPSDAPGIWRKDPISQFGLALGAKWGAVEPFVLDDVLDFRAPPPPPLDSLEYADAFAEVKALGGDGITTLTARTAEQTETGIYWAYDGTPSLCAPPRMYNQIAVLIATRKRSSLVELARLLALVNTALADAGIAAWESKYHYQLWRPVTGIREADPETGPTGLGDGNSATLGDPSFSPLGAPASNLGPLAVNFTPPFPAYPSGHATFGGALFQTLRRFYGTDEIPFTFVSDELNGVTPDSQGNPRPLRPRSFMTLSQAEEENGQSRIYLGIHWAFDKTEGIAQGRAVADQVFENLFRPKRHHH
jgi:hypothetical protein